MSIAASRPGPLLGRDAEIELLASLLHGIGDGGGALVLLGEPGIGKSRLWRWRLSSRANAVSRC